MIWHHRQGMKGRIVLDRYKTIDVIVPVYKGKKYIRGIIRQLEACAERMSGDIGIDLVLVNDAPEDGFDEDYISESIDVRTVDTDRNRGIHGARVRGLSFCTGGYVMFLDQDDRIFPGYLESQLSALGGADAVVCRAREDGREVYGRAVPFAGTIDREKMICAGNTIVSPGQVLMRRAAVPDAWKRDILENNGADDWFLWICMMQQGCRFVLNEEVLFEHRISGDNRSWDSMEMLRSEDEMLGVIRAGSVLDGVMLRKLEDLIASEQQRHIRILERYRSMFFIYDRWMDLEWRRGSISGYLYSQGIRRAAVYGMGHIGRQLAHRLLGTQVLLAGAIDRDAGAIDSDVRIVGLEEFDEETDLIVVAVADDTESILRDIRERTGARAVTMRQLLEDWESGGEIRNG